MDENSFPMSPTSLSPAHEDAFQAIKRKTKKRGMSKKEKEQMHRESAALYRRHTAHIEPANQKKKSMSQLLNRLKQPNNISSANNSIVHPSAFNENAAESSSSNDPPDHDPSKVTVPSSSGIKPSSSSIQFTSTPPSSPIKSSALKSTTTTLLASENRLSVDDIDVDDDVKKEHKDDDLPDLDTIVNADFKKRWQTERRQKLLEQQVKRAADSDSDSDNSIVFDDIPSSPTRQRLRKSVSPSISPKKQQKELATKNPLSRSNSDWQRAGKANHFDHHGEDTKNLYFDQNSLNSFLRKQAVAQVNDYKSKNYKEWLSRGARENVKPQQTSEETQNTNEDNNISISEMFKQKRDGANNANKLDLDNDDDDGDDEDWNDEGSATERGSADEDGGNGSGDDENEVDEEEEEDMGSADEGNENSPPHSHSEEEIDGDKENNGNAFNNDSDEDQNVGFTRSRRQPLFQLDDEEIKSPSSQARRPLEPIEIHEPQNFSAADAPSLHDNNNEDDDAGFSQFFNDEFSQEIGGSRFHREGFEKTDIDENDQLLPAIDQLPNIAPEDGAAQEDLALVNKLSFAGQGTQQEPEFRQYVNAQGFLTQTKPTDLFTTSPGASQFTQIASSMPTTLDSPSQHSPTSAVAPRRRLVKGLSRMSTQLASLAENDDDDEGNYDISPTQTDKEESQSINGNNRNAFSALLDGAIKDKESKYAEDSPTTRSRKIQSVFIDEQADESEDEHAYKLGASISKDKSDDEEDDDDDDNASLDGLVDNAAIDEELRAEQDARVNELAREHEHEADVRDLKVHQDVIDGKARRRRQGSLGVLSDEDYDDDDVFGNASKSKARKRKAALQANSTLEGIAKDPQKKAFAEALVTETGGENEEWLMGGGQDHDESEDEDDRAHKRRKSKGREVLEYDQYSSDHSIDLEDLGRDEEEEECSDEEPFNMPHIATSSSPQPGYKVHNQRKHKPVTPKKQVDELDIFYTCYDSENPRIGVLGVETDENVRSNARAVGKGSSITGLGRQISSGGKKNELKQKSSETKKNTNGISRKPSVLGQRRNIR